MGMKVSRGRRRVVKALAAVGIAGTGGYTMLAPRRANAYYSGPPSDHFDGVRFFNPNGPGPRGWQQLARFQLLEPRETWPASYPSPFRDRPPASVAGEGVRIGFVGHASFLVQTRGTNLLIDPVWSERASPFSFAGPRRVNPPGIAFDDLPRIDAVLVTHNHYDHMSIETLGRLWERFRPDIITPLGNDAIMAGRIDGLSARAGDWGDRFELKGGIEVHLEPTQHWSARGATDRMHALWASFVITNGRRKIYTIGDTGFGTGSTFRHVARRHRGIDLALLPIGAYEPRWFMQYQHVNPAEAVTAFELSRARIALGHHWGTFQLTAEAIERPLEELAAALAARGIDASRFPALRPGQVHELE